MMPGETHSKTAGIASEAAGSCQNCTSLQQSLNEYVAALIALKQKIIDSDQLLAEYQQKCDDILLYNKCNETLRCQLEQMLQKISPQEQHEEQLKALKAELDEKTSTLKIYQQTELEYSKVKEECEKNDIIKKKLEAKLKKMEESAAKQDKDYKQLKMEKKVIGKELKKLQKKLDGFQNEKNKKVVKKNAQTQVTRAEPIVKLDKQKIKYLLEEIWGCIESSTENGNCNLIMLDKPQLSIPETEVRKKRRGRKVNSSPEGKLSANHSSLRFSETSNNLDEPDIEQETLNSSEPKKSPRTISAVVEFREVHAFSEDATPNVLISKDQRNFCTENSDSESDIDEIFEVQDWAKPLPNLLSPLQCSPITMKNVFGEFSDSSDVESTNEMDQSNSVSQERKKNLLENGSDKTSSLNDVELILVTTDNFAVNSTLCSNDGPDITMEVETNRHSLAQTTEMLPLQEAQAVTKDTIHEACEDRSDHLTNNAACSKEHLTDTLKNPEPKLQNSAFCKRPFAEFENVDLTLNAENEIHDTACLTEEENMQLNNGVHNSTADTLTTSFSPSVTPTQPHDTVCKMKLDTLTCSNPESSTSHEASRSPATEDTFVNNDLHTDQDMSISVPRLNVTTVDCDQETVLHMQSQNCLEHENSDCSTDLCIGQNMTDDYALSKDSEKCLHNSIDVELSNSSEENLEKPLDTMPTLSVVNKCTEETMPPCIIHNEKNDLQSTLKSLEKNRPGEPLSQTSTSVCNSNPLSAISDCTQQEIDHEDIRANSTKDKPGDLDKTHGAPHKVGAETEKPNNMATSLNKNDSIAVNSTESQCESIDKNEDGLEKCSSQKENTLGHEHEQKNCHGLEMDQMASTSLLHDDDVYEKSGDSCQSQVIVCESVALPKDPKLEKELHTSHEDTTCIEASSDSPSHDPEKHNLLDTKLSSVVYSSPVDVAVDCDSKNEGNRITTQCQEVTQSIESGMDVNSRISEVKNKVHCPLSKASLAPVPVLPVEELQHLHTPSESSASVNKLENDATEACNASLDSSDSEYEFPVRKVDIARTALNNPIVRNESFKAASDATKGENESALTLNELEEQNKPSTLTHGMSKGLDTQIKLVNGSKMESNPSIEHKPLVFSVHKDSTNRVTSRGESAERSSDGKYKDISLQERERQKDVADHSHSDNEDEKNFRTSAEMAGQRIRPGKNLIWNFSRADDLDDSGVVCLTRKQKARSENVSVDFENSIRKSCVSNEKTQKIETSNKCKPSSNQTVKVENFPHRLQQGETILANADTSTSTGHSPETINKVRSEMGPPLPPLLGPLLSTPPRRVHTLSPLMSSSHSSLPSPLEEAISPLPATPFPPLISPLSSGRKRSSPLFNTPSPSEKANRRILSSPLQFCSATPKHAVPVPGRLPLSANGGPACNVQENSVKILDTMYPELSARARTLNILKGNVQLNRGMSGDGQNVPVSQITGFKSITSTSTVFIKTGSNSKTSNKENPNACETQLSSEDSTSVNKRAIDSFQMPKSAKRLRLDSEPAVAESGKDCYMKPANNQDAQKEDESSENSYCESLPDIVHDGSVEEDFITNAFKKVEELCFDLLPVIRSHVYVGTIPKVPVMRNEEKEVIYEFSSSKRNLTNRFLHELLKKLKAGKSSLHSTYLQALCRVYVGLCRQLGDVERARVLCYSILKEGFQDPDKLLLFIVSSWNDILSLHGVVSKAIQAVLKILAKDDVGSCLAAYLNWEKSPPMNISVLLNSVLMAIQLYPDVKFNQSEKYGLDLTDSVWEYVFAVDLLCSHHKWVWTNENVISKELWPILDKWVKRKKGNLTLQFIPDIIVATVLRLIGHLCQMGLKEGFITAVKNIISVIITFISHANEEDVPWGVQLASVYMLCDTAPCDPALVHQTLDAWKATAKNKIPPAVIHCMQEIAALCVQDK
ncbi:little elongation complex subunit 1 isoform 2-T4 [Leptodactylus fuscus]